jgi:cytochrome c5
MIILKKYYGKLLVTVCAMLVALPLFAAQKAENFPVYPTVNLKSGAASPEIIKKGEYLAKMGDCLGCHTDPKTRHAYAGGYQFPTPFGVIVSSNITPDKETGIGKWTQAQFRDAIKEGVSPRGYIYPAMPFNYYHQLPDADVDALFAYFMSVPAVHYQVPDNQMTWPFGWRFLQLGWRIMFFNPWNKFPEFTYDNTQSADWNRGRYIVEGLGHCIQCHGKLNALGAPEMKYKLTGGMILGFYAPNITKSHLGNLPEQKIMDVFKKNQMLNGGPVQGPMLEANMDSLRYLHDDDLHAIAVFLKSVDVPSPPAAKSSSLTGGALYESVCASCHTTGSSGAPILGDKAEWAKRLKENGGLPGLYQRAINGIGSMPAKGTCTSCTDAQIDSAVDYILKTTEESKGVSLPKATAPKLIRYVPTVGQKVYQAQCAACHSNDKSTAPQLGDLKAWQPILEREQLDVLFAHAIYGYGTMPGKKTKIGPNGKMIKGYCEDCLNSDLQQAVIYMVQKSSKNSNYTLW